MENRAMIQKSLDYIEENLRTEITAAELAEMAHVSLFHYYRQFQQATGLPVMQYILRRRLLHGVYAMKQGSTKIDAALMYGFDISEPASNAREAIQWTYFAYLGAIKEQNGAAMSLGRVSTFLDIYIERDIANGTLTE